MGDLTREEIDRAMARRIEARPYAPSPAPPSPSDPLLDAQNALSSGNTEEAVRRLLTIVESEVRSPAELLTISKKDLRKAMDVSATTLRRMIGDGEIFFLAERPRKAAKQVVVDLSKCPTQLRDALLRYRNLDT